MITSTISPTQALGDHEPVPEVFADQRRPGSVELTVLMPCLNEVRTLGRCIEKARQYLARENVKGEVVIADNGSTDGSQALAASLGARVVDVPTRGYGAALIAGIDAARGRYVIMGDSDDSYDFSDLSAYLSQLRRGYELVMGNRFEGGIRPGAMPALHRYLGNPVLSMIGRVLYRAPIKDFHCGLRGFDRRAMLSLNLRCPGMEFASEMIVKASLHGLSMVEVPTVLSPDGRDRPPHLRSWRDGWRHLRFLLLFSPRWLFLYPGLTLSVVGLLGLGLLVPSGVALGAITFDIHTLLYAAGALLVGVQLLTFAMFTKSYAVQLGVLPDNPRFAMLRRRLSPELGLAAGALLTVLGLALSVNSLLAWESLRFGVFDPRQGMRLVIPALTLLLLGLHLMFASMFMAVLGLGVHTRRESAARP